MEKESWKSYKKEARKELSPTFNIDLFDNYINRFREFYRDPDKSDCVIEIEIEKKGSSSLYDEDLKMYDIIENILTSLRLLEFSDVSINGLLKFTYTKVRGASIINGPTSFGESQLIYGGPSILFLDKKKINNFKKIYSVISDKIPKYFAYAIKKINDSHNRTEIFEKIIDLVIGLEALYMGGESNNISNNLAIRIAFDQETVSSNIEKKYNQVKLIYSIRSKAVHGDEDKIKKIINKSGFLNIGEIYEYTSNILRIGCINFINGYNKYKDWDMFFNIMKKKMFYRSEDSIKHNC